MDKGGVFKSCPSDITCYGLGDMFEGDFADTCAIFFADVDGGLSGGSSVRRPGSKEPHRRHRKFSKCVISHICIILPDKIVFT